MGKYFQKLTGLKFVLLIGLWVLLSGILGVVALGVSPQYAIPVVGILGYVILYFLFRVFGLNPIDVEHIIKKPEDKVEKKGILTIVPFLLGGLTSVLYVLFLQAFIPSLYDSYINQDELLQGMNFREFPLEVILIFISVVILAPIVEEFIFRGIFFNLLSMRNSTTFALVVSSLFFGLLHAQTMVPTAVIGFVLAFIYQKTGSLRLVIAGHMFNNFVAFAMSLITINLTENLTSQAVLGGILILFYVAGTLYFIRYMRANKAYFKKEAPLFRGLDPSTPLVRNNMPKVIDISFALESGMKVYPGDPEVDIREVANVEDHGFSLRKIQMNTHAGTHMDFPRHFIKDGPGEPEDLSIFYGKAQVILDFMYTVEEGVIRVIGKNGILTLDQAQDFISAGVKLIGTSLSSIEEEGQDQVHQYLLEHGVIILENLDLYGVIPGLYTLAAFPLKITEAEAAPTRAVLIDDVHRSF